MTYAQPRLAPEQSVSSRFRFIHSRFPSAAANLIACGLIGLISSSALASGYALREGTPDWLGNAFSGGPAKAYDASTAYQNPAGMTRLTDSEIDGAVSVIAPSANFTGINAMGPATTLPGSQGGNAVETAVSGGIYGVWDVAPKARIGLAVNVPYGQRVQYPADFVGRYQSLRSMITDISATLSVAYQLTPSLSLGLGGVVDRFSATLTQAVNIGVNALVGDPIATVTGHNYGVGFNVGALYQMDAATRVGIDYRSRIKHNISGAQSVSVPPALALASPQTAAYLTSLDSAADTSVTLPDSVSAGIYRDLSPRWAVMASVEWTHWALLNQIVILPENGAPASSLTENWRNTWFGGVGVNYKPDDRFTLQGGVSYDQSPVTATNRTTRIPDNNHVNVGAGLKYAMTRNVELSIAYLHVFVKNASINNAAGPTTGQIIGGYDVADNSATAGFNIKF
jgi:long-chain fatty acid transport protein